MSEILTALRNQASSLRNMLAEIEQANELQQQRDWELRVPAAAVVGSDTEISYWALTEHFLLTWIRWFQVSRLYSVYFGHGPPTAPTLTMIPGFPMPMFPGLPKRWGALHQRCQVIKDRLASDADLPEILANAWRIPREREPHLSIDDVDEMFVDLVESHERLRLLEVYSSLPHTPWRGLHERVLARDRQLGRALDTARSEIRETVLEHLRAYRHATLDVSWLRGAWNPVPWDSPDRLSALRRPALEPVPDEHWGARLAGELQVEHDLAQQLSALLSRIQRAIWEIGFACLAEDVTAKDFQPGSATPVGTPSLGLNRAPVRSPSQIDQVAAVDISYRVQIADMAAADRGRERLPIEPDRLLLYVSKPGRGGWKRASRTLEIAAAYLAQAPRRPDLVTILLDTWDPNDFSARHRSQLRPYARSGVHFLFLLADTDRRVSRLDVSV